MGRLELTLELDTDVPLFSIESLPMMPSMPSAALWSTPHRIESASKPSSTSKWSSPGSSGAAAASSGVAGDGAGSRNSLKTLLTAAGDGQLLATPAGLCGGGGRSRRRKAAWPSGTGNGGRREEQDGSSPSAEARPRRRGGTASGPPQPLATGNTEGYMDASSAAASLYVWLGRFRGVRGRLSDSDATDEEEAGDELDASESVEDAAECAGRGGGGGGGGAALTISRSGSRMPPAGMHDDAMVASTIDQPVDPETETSPRNDDFPSKTHQRFSFSSWADQIGKERNPDLGDHGTEQAGAGWGWGSELS
jgi:hypothetical protein